MPVNKPIRPRSHIIEDVSRLFFRHCAPLEWIIRDVFYDYGLDLNVEIVEDYRVTGLNFSIQLKAIERANDSKTVPIRLKKSTLEYMIMRLEPVMLVAYVSEDREAYWLWLKDACIDLNATQKTFQISIPRENRLSQTNWTSIAEHVRNIFGKKLNIDSPEADTKRFGRYSIEISGSPLLQEGDIHELERLVNSPNTKEAEIQKFLESHPQTFLGGEYVKLHAQLKLEADDQVFIPDFFVKSVTGFSDILEIKLPTTKILTGSSNRRRYTFQVTSAVSQTQVYRDFFENEKNRKWFKRVYKLEVYRPQTILVIGRDSDFNDRFDHKRLESYLRDFRIFTYDDLLRIARSNLYGKI